MIGASTVETLVAVKNALDGAPIFVHLDLDVIDPEHFPAAVPAPNGLRTSSTTCSTRCSRTPSCSASRSPNFEVPDDEEESAVATETAMHVLEPFLDHLAGQA